MCVFKIKLVALTGVAQWVGHRPMDQKVTCSIPGWGTCLGCGPSAWLGYVGVT